MKIKPTYILSGFMIAVLVFAGLVAITTDAFSNVLPRPRNQLFGSVLILYALMRFSRLRRQLVNDKHSGT